MSANLNDGEALMFLVDEITALREQLNEQSEEMSGMKHEIALLKENDHFGVTDLEPSSSSTSQELTAEGNKLEQPKRGNPEAVPGGSHSLRKELGVSFVEGDELEPYELPLDVFSMFFFAHYRSQAFLYAVVIYSFQLLSLSIITYDLLDDDLREGDSDGNKFNVPITVEWQVQVARCIAILISVVSRDDCLETFRIVTIGFKSRWRRKFPGASIPQFVMMNVMRFSEGAFVIFVSFIFIVQSDNVLDLFLNFAAIEFISSLDNLAYDMAKDGWLSRSMQELTEQISETKIYLTIKDRQKLHRKQYIKHFLMVSLLVALYAGYFKILVSENEGSLLVQTACSHVRFEFGEQQFIFSRDAPDFEGFESEQRSAIVFGNFSFELTSLVDSARPLGSLPLDTPPPLVYSAFSNDYIARAETRVADRYVYDENGYDDITSGMFYYCENELSWVFTIRALARAGAVPQETIDRCGDNGWLLRSEETRAYSLDEVPEHGWKIWVGTLVDATDIEIYCTNCNSDIDCGIDRGNCDKGVCVCEPGFTGSFCDREEPCDKLASYVDGGADIMTINGMLSYDRPIYQRLIPDATATLLTQEFQLLLYNGRRWSLIELTGADLAIFAENIPTMKDPAFTSRFSRLFHAYWSDIGVSKMKRISDETDMRVPTGHLDWYSFGVSGSTGDYGIYGYILPNTLSYECLSVDCDVANLCGTAGECLNVTNILLFGDTIETNTPGNQCVCKYPFTGHFCEYRNAVEWDENGTITRGPFQLDPFQAACYGPHHDLPNCLEKLYPDLYP